VYLGVGPKGQAGNGGIGLASSITGTSVYYAGGGGAGADDVSWNTLKGIGGLGGGGTGGQSGGAGAASATDGTVNTGGGAGGVSLQRTSVNGGSGIVIISYPSIYPDLASIGAGLTYAKTTSGGNTIYTFTAGTGTVTI
jgi:hypothetical protein